MKEYSFYQYMKTKVNENSSEGALAERIAKDTMFPKYTKDYNEVSDYLEKNPYDDISLTVFDDAFEQFKNWLEH